MQSLAVTPTSSLNSNQLADIRKPNQSHTVSIILFEPVRLSAQIIRAPRDLLIKLYN